MKKNVIPWSAVLMILAAAGGCSKPDSSAGTSSGGSSGVPTVIWWQIGNTQAGLAEDLKIISDYSEQKIGVRLEVKQAGWGEAGTRFTTMINAGEYYDILFTDLGSYNRFVSLGAFKDITDTVKTVTPKLYDAIPQILWDGVKIKGNIYSVPTYKDSSKTAYYFWDHAIVTKYGVDLNQSAWSYLDQIFRKIKEGEGRRYYPMILYKGSNTFIFDIFDSLAADLNPLGVELTDQNHRVVNTLEDPRVLEKLRYLHTWFTDGIINPEILMR
jgi:putative aldouronate transport system substrate-binding protein